MSATTNGDDEEELVQCGCGHEVEPDAVVSLREVRICENCYTPFPVTDWPENIGTYNHRVIEARGTSKVVNTTYLLGLDARGRAVYYSGENNRILTFVPKNDRNYRQDRQEALESKQEYHNGLHQLRPRRNQSRSAGAGPASKDSFVTLPDGDHMVRVNTSEKIKSRELDEWMVENTEDWQAVHPDKAEAFQLEKFGTTSGKPKVDKRCKDCGHVEEDIDPEDQYHCPECDTHKFYEVADTEEDQ